MPFTDLINKHYTATEVTTMLASIAAIEAIIDPKARNLTPEERTQYGSINETNKLLVNKVRDYKATQPALSSPDIDWTEYEADWQDRSNLQALEMRLNALIERVTDTKILHDHDNFQNALLDYKYTKYKADTDAGGYTTKHDELKQFFPNTGGGSTT